MNLLKTISGLALMGLLCMPILGYGQTKQGEKVNWIECIGTDVTEFGGYCLDNEKNNARAYLTNNCTEKVKVWYEFTGPCYKSRCKKTGYITLAGNSKKRVSFCDVTENNGSIRVTKVEPIGQQLKNSPTNQTSNITQKRDEEWNEDESLLGFSNSSATDQKESIYGKRQREAREREKREREHYRKQQEQVNRKIRQGEDRINKIENAKNTWENRLQSAQDQLMRKQEAEWARSRRIEEEQREEYRREQAEFAKRRAIQEQKRKKEEQKRDAQRNFINNLSDQNLPISFNHNKAYVIFVQHNNTREFKLIPGILYKTSDNHLPYKQDILNKLKQDRNLYRVKVYGVYDNFDEFKKSANQLYAAAQQNYIAVEELNRFEHGTSRENKTNENTNDKDFWGNDKSKTKKTTKDDFWNN